MRSTRRIARAAAAMVFTAGIVTAVGVTNAHAAGDYEGCAYGAVCIYPNAGWNGGRPSLAFYSFGAHNIYGQTGVHRVFNNQTGKATARTCTGYNGTGCQGYLMPYTYIDKDLTPIYSITLEP
jgi:hypothetical protein